MAFVISDDTYQPKLHVHTCEHVTNKPPGWGKRFRTLNEVLTDAANKGYKQRLYFCEFCDQHLSSLAGQ